MFYPRTETFEAWFLVNEPLSVQGQLRRWFYHFYLPRWAKFELENYAGRPSFGAFSRRCGPGMLPRPMPLTYPKRRKRFSWHLGFNTQKTHQNPSCSPCPTANFGAFSHGNENCFTGQSTAEARCNCTGGSESTMSCTSVSFPVQTHHLPPDIVSQNRHASFQGGYKHYSG